MNLKNSIILIVTIIYILLSVIFITFQVFELKQIQNNDVNLILEKITKEIKEGDIKKETISSFKPELFFAIWLKKEDKWIPIIHDKDIDIYNIDNPLKIPSSIIYVTRIYLNNVDNFQFLIWINKFAKEYYIKNLFLPILVLIFIYLFITFIINLIFYPIKGVDYFDQKNYVDEKDYNNYEDLKLNEEERDLLKEYKELWRKNYKISEDFKNNFPFRKIYDLMRFGIKTEDYLKEALIIASKYFKWENPTIYLKQKGYFIDIINKNNLNESLIEIPLKGDKKGDVFIPLYPFGLESLFGYLYFQWHRLEDFYIADILYFLKYIFSEDTKFIFTNQNEQKEIVDYLNKALSKKNNEVAVILIAVDNREKLRIQLKPTIFELLNNKIFNRVKEDYKKDYIFRIMPLYFGIIAENIIPEKLIEYLQKWKNNNHTYPISANEPDISVTFSIGVAFKKNRELHPIVLINEAEKYLKIARNNGGNQLSF